MSFKDVRTFTEQLRVLSCPHRVSLESFRQPNFPLVAALVTWLVERLDDEIDLPAGPFLNEQDRVVLVRAVAQFLAVKLNVKLNTKNLYSADGYAVKELLKITNVLTGSIDSAGGVDDGEEFNIDGFDLSEKIDSLKRTRQLSSELTSTGAVLYGLLDKETELRVQRQKSISRPLELADIELDVKTAIEGLKKTKERINEQIENVGATEVSLDQRIERKQSELERSRNRLQTLEKVKPAFLDEFANLEKELKSVYFEYVSKYRTMVYLESIVEEQERMEALRVEDENERNRARADVPEKFMDLPEMDDNDLPNDIVQNDLPKPDSDRLRVKTGVIRPKTGARVNSRMFGSMRGATSNSDTSMTTSDSDSEDILLNDADLDDYNITGVPVSSDVEDASYPGDLDRVEKEIERTITARRSTARAIAGSGRQKTFTRPSAAPSTALRRSTSRLSGRLSQTKLRDIEDDDF